MQTLCTRKYVRVFEYNFVTVLVLECMQVLGHASVSMGECNCA